MSRCPISYQPADCGLYSKEGLQRLSPQLHSLKIFPFTESQQLELALQYAGTFSFSGVQPKLNARLNLEEGEFEVVRSGDYLLKLPLGRFPGLPQNEDVTMRLASLGGIDVPLHGLMYAKDRSMIYFVQRFDRRGRTKFAFEDLGQLLGIPSEKKYEGSLEQVGKALDKHTTFPLLEKEKLFRLVLFSFLVGNDDLHLKNFSLLRKEGKAALSPAYDLVSSTLAMPTREESALTLRGKRSKFRRSDFVEYFGVEQLRLSEALVTQVLEELKAAIPQWKSVIEASFLPEEKQERYQQLIDERAKRLFH
jgi:serine/threonine-protein kinase HipA